MSAYFAGRPASSISRSTLSTALLLLTSAIAFGQGFPQDNVSTGGLTPAGWLDAGNPLKQMNEPDCAVTPGRPNVVVCGMNDYSGVDPESLDVPGQPFEARSIGDSSAGIAMSTDGGRRWVRGLHPCHFADTGCSIGQKYMADPNLSAAPGVLFYSVMAGYRDGTAPGGLFMFTWLENNTEVGQPYIFNKFDQIAEGTGGSGPGGKFLDKPDRIIGRSWNTAGDFSGARSEQSWHDRAGGSTGWQHPFRLFRVCWQRQQPGHQDYLQPLRQLGFLERGVDDKAYRR